MPKIRNIIIFVAIAAAFILAFVIITNQSSSSQPNIVASGGNTSTTSAGNSGSTTANASDGTPVAQNLLTILLNVKTIKLDDKIFSDPAFVSLHDSSITLTPDATIGRINPFAQFGTENVAASTTAVVPVTDTSTISPATLPVKPTVTPKTTTKSSKASTSKPTLAPANP